MKNKYRIFNVAGERVIAMVVPNFEGMGWGLRIYTTPVHGGYFPAKENNEKSAIQLLRALTFDQVKDLARSSQYFYNIEQNKPSNPNLN